MKKAVWEKLYRMNNGNANLRVAMVAKIPYNPQTTAAGNDICSKILERMEAVIADHITEEIDDRWVHFKR